MKRKWLFIFGPVAIVAIAVLVALGGELVRLLWNWLTPALFGWPQITLWQAIGLLALSRILVGGIGGGSPRQGWRRQMGDRMMGRMADRMADRWEHMTPEERERFRRSMRRCGFVPASEAAGNPPESPNAAS